MTNKLTAFAFQVCADAKSGQIGAKLGNQFDKSSFIRKTYSPIDLSAVRATDEARKRGRK